MIVKETSTCKFFKVEILPVENSDYKKISKKRYFFDWQEEKEQEVYKLRIIGSEDIIGLVSIERLPEEWRIHIRLLTVSKENKGSEKKYENIIGNLLTYISKIAIKEYAELACVSLKPKSKIAQHYIDKYGMNITGVTLSIELKDIMKLIESYDHD